MTGKEYIKKVYHDRIDTQDTSHVDDDIGWDGAMQ